MLLYDPKLHCNVGGTYLLHVGDLFYVGSTKSFGRRYSNHKVGLERGEHWNEALYQAYLAGAGMDFEILEIIERKPADVETEKDYVKRLKLHEQWLLDKWFGKPGCVNVSSDSGFNTTIGEWMKAKWCDPEFRETQVARLKARRGAAVTAETREKMAEAKRGKRNARSRACTLWFHDEKLRFDSATAAARHFGVTQQVMDLWLRGSMGWPGANGRTPRSDRGRQLVGLMGGYDSDLGDLVD